MVSILLNHVFIKFNFDMGLAENSRVVCVMFDLVLVVFLDDVVVAHHHPCCCCVYLGKGDLLMPRKIMVVCCVGLSRVEWWCKCGCLCC